MIVLPDVLGPEDIMAVRQGLEAAPFRDGRATAGAAAEQVKSNAQARGDDPGVAALARRVRLALEAHPTLRSLVRPTRWSSLIFSRYGPGQQYGLHVDNAGMFDAYGAPLRTDFSFTLFLSDPETYAGGDLIIQDLSGERAFRPAAGAAVVYPTGHLHRVAPVTQGERLACVGWVQSLIRRADQRELLYDLERARAGLAPGGASLLIDKSIGGLLRLWGEN
ncbi:Fe2+-dependent dioxygenase [Phenylobacterium sp.]|uniref:Fe2+-dependent dioxygenase n=1 Tax=Phenylobacterium sp. TaxID=1871053 RepID=UPI002730C57C|nr:Fe2+-dependent dioxygenase [Phenylobacterium sp.]MDP1617390.1 Fe2+-dependent dioxygenase [Phenylobacterium sp.]MDP1985916.1 Fe2+-dependent dioxygenase [Phenylobacterium sp.]